MCVYLNSPETKEDCCRYGKDMGSCGSGGKVGCPLTRKSAIWSHSPPFHMLKCPWARYRTCIAPDSCERRCTVGMCVGEWPNSAVKLFDWSTGLERCHVNTDSFSRVCFEYIAAELHGQIYTCILKIIVFIKVLKIYVRYLFATNIPWPVCLNVLPLNNLMTVLPDSDINALSVKCSWIGPSSAMTWPALSS